MKVEEIYYNLSKMMDNLVPPLQVRAEKSESKELAGTKEVMQGRKKVDGIYFASIVKKPKDVRLYFFPIYTHADAFSLSEKLKKMLKGKSCFHVNSMDEGLLIEIRQMLEKGVDEYQKSNWI